MRVLGLDPGSRRTGFGVVEGHGRACRCLEYGILAPGDRLPLPQRLRALADGVTALLERLQPDTVVIEESFVHENARSALVLGHVRGALLVAAVRHGAAVAEYAPREIKLAVTGSGAAAKQQVAFMVRRQLGLAEGPAADAADALAAALCHLRRQAAPAPARRPARAGAR